MISVVCVYNNQAILEDHLLKSLDCQSVRHERVLMDNRQGQFRSAAQALNKGGGTATGQYIMFAHQDVELLSDTWLKDIEEILTAIPDLGIAGVAGARKGEDCSTREVVTTIMHGVPADCIPDAVAPEGAERVQTVDECLFIVPRTVFDSLQFDETVCDDWHLYAVDYCLSILDIGLTPWVIPASVHHRSAGITHGRFYQAIPSLGPYPAGYYGSLKKLLRKHRSQVEVIYTTTECWNTSYPLIVQRVAALARAYLRDTWWGLTRK